MSIVPLHLSPHNDVLCSLDELRSRCAAAVRLAYRGERYGDDAKDEAVGRLLMAVWETLPTAAPSTGVVNVQRLNTARRRYTGRRGYRRSRVLRKLTQPMPAPAAPVLYLLASAPAATSLNGRAPIYSKHSAKKSRDRLPLEVQRAAVPRDLVPSFTTLRNRAVDLRRQYDASQARDLASRPVELDPTLPQADEGNCTLNVTCDAAHSRAVEMTLSLGWPIWRKPMLYALAYSAAREGTLWNLGMLAQGEKAAPAPDLAGWRPARTDGAPIGPQIASELGLAVGTLHVTLQRARDLLASEIPGAVRPAAALHNGGEHKHRITRHPGRVIVADALDLPAGGIGRKPSRSRTLSADLNDSGERDAQPVIETTWTARTQAPQAAMAPDWTRTLSSAQHDRLAAAAALSVGKAAREARTREDRATLRQLAADGAREDARSC